MTIECTIPQKFHRSIMGPKGSRIQQITRDYGVQIKFPDREENPGIPMDACSHGSWGDQMCSLHLISGEALLKICGEVTPGVPCSVLGSGLGINRVLLGRGATFRG